MRPSERCRRRAQPPILQNHRIPGRCSATCQGTLLRIANAPGDRRLCLCFLFLSLLCGCLAALRRRVLRGLHHHNHHHRQQQDEATTTMTSAAQASSLRIPLRAHITGAVATPPPPPSPQRSQPVPPKAAAAAAAACRWQSRPSQGLQRGREGGGIRARGQRGVSTATVGRGLDASAASPVPSLRSRTAPGTLCSRRCLLRCLSRQPHVASGKYSGPVPGFSSSCKGEDPRTVQGSGQSHSRVASSPRRQRGAPSVLGASPRRREGEDASGCCCSWQSAAAAGPRGGAAPPPSNRRTSGARERAGPASRESSKGRALSKEGAKKRS